QTMPLIGFAAGATVKLNERFLADVRKGLAEYVEGQNFRFEFRQANLQNDLLPILFRELVDQKVSVIITFTTVGLQSGKAATQSIPIVFTIGADPVENGFVASLNKPAPDEFEAAFEAAVRGGAGGMIVGSDAVFFSSSTQLVAVAARYRLP